MTSLFAVSLIGVVGSTLLLPLFPTGFVVLPVAGSAFTIKAALTAEALLTAGLVLAAGSVFVVGLVSGVGRVAAVFAFDAVILPVASFVTRPEPAFETGFAGAVLSAPVTGAALLSVSAGSLLGAVALVVVGFETTLFAAVRLPATVAVTGDFPGLLPTPAFAGVFVLSVPVLDWRRENFPFTSTFAAGVCDAAGEEASAFECFGSPSELVAPLEAFVPPAAVELLGTLEFSVGLDEADALPVAFALFVSPAFVLFASSALSALFAPLVEFAVLFCSGC